MEPFLHLGVFLILLKEINVSRPDSPSQACKGELPYKHSEENHDERGPPKAVLIKALQQASSNSIDVVVCVRGTERKDLDEPATGGKEGSNDGHPSLVVHLKDLHLDADDYHAGCERQGAHSVDTVILRQRRIPVQLQHDEEDNYCIGGSHEGPPREDPDIEVAIPLSLKVQLDGAQRAV